MLYKLSGRLLLPQFSERTNNRILLVFCNVNIKDIFYSPPGLWIYSPYQTVFTRSHPGNSGVKKNYWSSQSKWVMSECSVHFKVGKMARRCVPRLLVCRVVLVFAVGNCSQAHPFTPVLRLWPRTWPYHKGSWGNVEVMFQASRGPGRLIFHSGTEPFSPCLSVLLSHFTRPLQALIKMIPFRP